MPVQSADIADDGARQQSQFFGNIDFLARQIQWRESRDVYPRWKYIDIFRPRPESIGKCLAVYEDNVARSYELLFAHRDPVWSETHLRKIRKAVIDYRTQLCFKPPDQIQNRVGRQVGPNQNVAHAQLSRGASDQTQQNIAIDPVPHARTERRHDQRRADENVGSHLANALRAKRSDPALQARKNSRGVTQSGRANASVFNVEYAVSGARQTNRNLL